MFEECKEYKTKKLQGWSKKEESEMRKIGIGLLGLLEKGTQFTNVFPLFAKLALGGGRKKCSITVGHIGVRNTVKF